MLHGVPLTECLWHIIMLLAFSSYLRRGMWNMVALHTLTILGAHLTPHMYSSWRHYYHEVTACISTFYSVCCLQLHITYYMYNLHIHVPVIVQANVIDVTSI